MTSPQVDYLIVGAGVNGTSIATTLISLGFTVSVLDRSPDGFVAPDGASHDLNKIVRADYTDPNYCTLAKEAISRWRSSPVLSPFYHEVGVFFRSSDKGTVFKSMGGGSAEEYVENGVLHAGLERDRHLEVAAPGEGGLKREAYKLVNDKQVQEIMKGVGGEVKLGKGLQGMGKSQTGYFNPRGGWAEANNACRALLSHAVKLGVQVHPNSTVTSFTYDPSGKITGVKTTSGQTFSAKNVILAAGAWTSDLLTTLSSSSVPLEEGSKWMTRPSAQCVAVLRVTPSEAAQLKNSPVIINFSSGFYQFEPVLVGGDEWQMKIAYHSNGYLYPKPPIECTGKYPCFEDSLASKPTGTREIGAEGERSEDIGYEMAESTIPSSRLDQMLQELSQIYPTLATQDRIISTRVCWYSDTLDENWIIDTLNNHPHSSSSSNKAKGENVWVVSGDSGHAYKFLPMIGDLFATIAGLSPNTRKLDLSRFRFTHQAMLHKDKKNGKKVQSADSNRFDPTKDSIKVLQNLRARL